MSEGKPYHLGPGDMLLTKAGDYHSLLVTKEMVAVYYYGVRYQRFFSWMGGEQEMADAAAIIEAALPLNLYARPRLSPFAPRC
jgi:hypothetical protein